MLTMLWVIMNTDASISMLPSHESHPLRPLAIVIYSTLLRSDDMGCYIDYWVCDTLLEMQGSSHLWLFNNVMRTGLDVTRDSFSESEPMTLTVCQSKWGRSVMREERLLR